MVTNPAALGGPILLPSSRQPVAPRAEASGPTRPVQTGAVAGPARVPPSPRPSHPLAPRIWHSPPSRPSLSGLSSCPGPLTAPLTNQPQSQALAPASPSAWNSIPSRAPSQGYESPEVVIKGIHSNLGRFLNENALSSYRRKQFPRSLF